MLVVLPPVFVADARINYGYNFVAPLNGAHLNKVIDFKYFGSHIENTVKDISIRIAIK